MDTRTVLMDVMIEQGLLAVNRLLAESVAELCGPRHARREAQAPRGWGTQGGELVLGGRRVKLMRPRVRQGAREVTVPAYARFQEEDALHERALEQMLVGVSTRKYRRSLEDFPGVEESGTSKSAVSRRFVAATTKRLAAILGKPLQGIEWAAVMIDGLRFGEHVILVALGIDAQGCKHVLGLREGAMENATVCKDLLVDLVERGFPADRHLLWPAR
jgi:transposase-like protein